MSNTVIMGDIAEGQKWFGEAEFLKQQLKHLYNRKEALNAVVNTANTAIFRPAWTANPHMSTWKQVNADVKIFVKMVNGNPQAFIFTEGGYEFTVPVSPIAWELYTYTGVNFYNGVETLPAKILSNATEAAAPYNIWYSLEGYVTNVAAARYRNVFNVSGQQYLYAYLNRARVYSGGTTQIYRAVNFTSAAAVVGRYLWGIQPGPVPGNCVVFVEDMITRQVVLVTRVAGAWPVDSSGTKDAHGFWSFNRAGTKACTVVWVPDAERFGETLDAPSYVPTIGRLHTSHVMELEILLDGEGIFTGNISVNRQVETSDFCIAADYDWTTEENELVIATVHGFDYRFDKAVLANRDALLRGDILGKVGDHFCTVYTSGAVVRPRSIYELIGFHTTSGGVVLADYSNISLEHTACDLWLKIATVDGLIIKTVELAHNIDTTTKESSAGTWYEKPGPSFINYISGMDLRVRGITGYSTSGAVVATAYDRDWTNGSSLQSSGAAMPTTDGNYYLPDRLYAPIKIMKVTQTITAIPYLKKDPWEIRNLCVYAPCIIDEETGDTDPNKALDFRIDLQTEQSAASAFQEGYHRKVFELTHSETPYLNRYFTTGAWAKKKERA